MAKKAIELMAVGPWMDLDLDLDLISFFRHHFVIVVVIDSYELISFGVGCWHSQHGLLCRSRR